MLTPDQVDLGDVAQARNDHSYETSWWLDPDTGQVQPWLPDAGLDEGESPKERGWTSMRSRPSHDSYQDMAAFVEQVRDVRARDLLDRAITGRGAFRRFKDTLFDFPELRAAWFAFHEARSRRDALEWLASAGLVDPAAAERARPGYADPGSALLEQPIDAEAIASSVAVDLRRLYGQRLKQVVLFGSHARGTADEESDIDLLVVLDQVASAYEELRTMDDVMWQHTYDNNVAVSAVAGSEARYREAATPFLSNVAREGRRVS